MSGQVETANAWGADVASAPPAHRRPRHEALAPYILLAPSLFFLAVFVIWPMARAFVLAFQDQQGHTGLSSFHTITADYQFRTALRNTLLFTVVLIPIEFAAALGMAMLLQSHLRARQFFLYVWTIPLAVSDLAAGIVWFSIFTQRGYLNTILVDLGLTQNGYDWLSYQNPVSLFLCVVLAELWRSTSLVMLILLGGLQGIPKEFGEAADVFGATAWQRLRHITLPLLRPAARVALILRTIFAFQVFAVVIALAGQNLPVVGSQAYYYYTSYFNPNAAAAYAILILGLSIVTSTVYLTVLRTKPEVLGRRR